MPDEPTGNLDSHTTTEVMALFQRLNRQGITIVVVTHEPDTSPSTRRASSRCETVGSCVYVPVTSRRDATTDLEQRAEGAA